MVRRPAVMPLAIAENPVRPVSLERKAIEVPNGERAKGLSGTAGIAEAVSRWVTVDRLDLEEGVVVWNRLVNDTLTSAFSE
jgi:hypothetical protein